MDQREVIGLYNRLSGQWSRRNAEYGTARRRYAGEHWGDSSNPTPTNRYSLTLNYLKPFVDKSVQLLVGRLPAIQVLPNGTDEAARRHAEQLEGILYGTWEQNGVGDTLFKVAWDSFVLRRGIAYVWWDPKNRQVRFKHVVPDHFYPEYDGDEMWRAVYVSRRSTDRLKAEYPEKAGDIVEDQGALYQIPLATDPSRAIAPGQTTVFDVFEVGGAHTRLMGNAVIEDNLGYPFKDLPFIEFPCFPTGSGGEPLNMVDQLVELNQYLDQLVSQKADIISRYANPTVIDKGSGQPASEITKALAAQGAVIPCSKQGDISLLNWQGTTPTIDAQMVFILDTMFDLAGKPRSSFGQTVTNQSGVVTNLTLTPTLQSNEAHETIWGAQLSKLNEFILQLWEKFMAGERIEMKGRKWLASGTMKHYDVEITGSEIGGWTKNRMKWPSAIRTDDPIYVQNHLQQLQASPFPAISLYTYLEEMGREDVEAEVDRIGEQLLDPRFHPDRMEAGINAATALQGMQVPPMAGGPAGLPGPTAGSVSPALALNSALEGGGNPNRDAMMAVGR